MYKCHGGDHSKWSNLANMGVGFGWGGMLKFMLRWWCYADHGGWGGGVGC